jgi:hypothetical protein
VINSEACKPWSVEKATRAHSTRARQPVEAGEGSDSFGFAEAGEVDTLLRVRGRKGVIGTEVDLRSRVRLDISFFIGDRNGFATGGDFTASPKAFSVAFITCVASNAFSFGLKSLVSQLVSPARAAVGAFRAGRFVVVVEGFVLIGSWAAFRVVDLRGGLEDASLLSCLP